MIARNTRAFAKEKIVFDLSNYEPVENRIKKFYEIHNQGRIITELIAYSDTQFIVKTSVYRNAEDTQPAATGLAEEKVGSNPVNRTSCLENCETSSIGRALANLNFASKLRPSSEEMAKVNAYETANGSVPRESWKDSKQGAWAEVGKASEKQLKFVYSILIQAFTDAGFGDSGISYVDLGNFLQASSPITQLEDITSKQASMIINDKTTAGNKLTKLVEFLQSTKGPNAIDPWAKADF